MKKISKKYPLIVESHPEDYQGYEFITLIQYNDENHLTIVDNSNNKFIDCYVLDFCKTSKVDEAMVITVAEHWFLTAGRKHPISIEFSRRELTSELSPIVRRFSIDYVTRVIGPLPHFNMTGTTKVRKRKRKGVPNGVRIIQKRLIQRL